MRVGDVQQLLARFDPSPEEPGGVDRLIVGDAQRTVHGIAVMWMPYRWALEQAHAAGCNLVIVHEPTFYEHHDRDPRWVELPAAQAKRRFLEDHAINVVRCHDAWDRAPGLGVPDSWGSSLGLTEGLSVDRYLRVHDVEQTTAQDFALRVATAVAYLGQEAVQLIGRGDTPVRRVLVGTGAITPVRDALVEHRVDLAVCTDDGIHYWRDGALAIDAGLPLVVVSHGVSEEAAMVSLAHTLADSCPEVPVLHIPQACMYRLVAPPGKTRAATEGGRAAANPA